MQRELRTPACYVAGAAVDANSTLGVFGHVPEPPPQSGRSLDILLHAWNLILHHGLAALSWGEVVAVCLYARWPPAWLDYIL